jgi:glyoxylase-like metal-dependent hydrolase (beta-lactamase superfamily II)
MKTRTLLFTLAAAWLLGSVPTLAQEAANEPGIALQGADRRVVPVGDVDVIALSDGTVPQDLHVLLRGASKSKTDALLKDAFQTNPVEASINVFLFKIPGHVVLVDTGSGDMFGPGYGGKLLQSLAAVAITPDQITDVLLTHAHDDHMGGLVHDGRLVFSNATVHVNQADVEFFMDRRNSRKFNYAMSYFDQAATALKPVLDAGKVKSFRGTAEILPGVTATSHPGHTPGSVFYTLTSRGQSITFTGDIIHVAAVQAPDPDVTITYDVDPVQAAAVRKHAFARFASERALVAVPHLPFPGIGHFRRLGSGYEWEPVAYTNRAPTGLDDYADPHKNGDKGDKP